jgi:hypothetical protein
MGRVLIKPGVEFAVIRPAGARILEVLRQVTRELSFDVTITSATEGQHSGPNDPHHKGEAYDLRTKTLTEDQKRELLSKLVSRLGPRFFAFLEAPGTPNEHIHVQRRRNTVYTIQDYLAA